MKRQQGLTLIEILVAMSLMAILTVMGYRAFGNLLLAREHVMQVGEQWVEIARVLRRLESELLRQPRQADGARHPAALRLEGGADGQLLDLWLETASNMAGLETVQYRGGAGLRWQVRAEGETASGEVYPLLPANVRASWRVLDGNGQWHASWPPAGSNAQARALEMRLQLPGEEMVRRVWSLR